MKHRHQAVIPFAILYVLLLAAYCLAGPVRIARAFLQEVIKGSGNVIHQNRPVSGFNAVVVSGIGELTATQGKEESLSVDAEDNIAPVIETVVKDDCLYIKIQRDARINPTKPIRYTLSAKDLKRVGISGVIKANFGKWESETLELSASGATRLHFDAINSKELTGKLSGASDLSVSGAVNHQKLDLSGACHYKAEDLASKIAEVDASGASNAKLQVSEALTASASGASSIRYKGSPTVTRKTSGVSSIRASTD